MLSRRCRVLAIADDMTGALEVGAKLAQLGCLVTTTNDVVYRRDQRALVLDTETRHVGREEAADRIYAIAQEAREPEIEVIYKKTDSTLRGNVGSEIQALARAYPEKPIVFAPAYPMLGRTVRDGYLLVEGEPVHRTTFGRDALNPVATSRVMDVLGDAERVRIFDAETEADVAAVVQMALAKTPVPVFCGPGSVASHLAAALGCSDVTPDLPVIKNALVVNGSRHETGQQQIEHALKCGWPMLSSAEVSGSDWTILDCAGQASKVAATVRGILARTPVGCLIVFGGDTAYEIIRSLEECNINPLGELFPGVPISRAGQLLLITKAGGFGPVDLLSKIHDALAGRG